MHTENVLNYDHKEKSFSHDYKDENCRIIEICSRCEDKRLESVKHKQFRTPFVGTGFKIDGKNKNVKTVVILRIKKFLRYFLLKLLKNIFRAILKE